MDGDDVKITTGEGRGPETPPVSPSPMTPPASQPDFLSSDNLAPSPVPAGVEAGPRPLRVIVFVLVGLIFVVGIGALGYFVIYPIIFPAKAPAENPAVNTLPPVTQASHASYLKASPSGTAEIKLGDTNYPTIASALQNESLNQLADGQYKEVRISSNSGQVPFAAYLGGVSPATKALALGDWFENDFTALLYYDPAGVWPVYVAKLKQGVAPSAVMSGFKGAEGVLDLSNFYLNSPGTFSAFKDGKVATYATRYTIASTPGAAFNYGVAGDYFIISTNYNALKGVLPKLGL